MYIVDLPVLNEAEITHGGSIRTGFNSLPPDLQAKVRDKLKARGKSEDEIKTLTSKYTAFAFNSQFKEDKVAIDGMDIIDGVVHHQLELYDKARDLAILQANDIVKAYKEAANASYDKAIKYLTENADNINQTASRGGNIVSQYFQQNEFDGLNRLLTSSRDAFFELTERYDFTEDELRRTIVENLFSNSENPNEIRDLIQARVTYSNIMVNMFKTMLQQNYKILGLTNLEASIMVQRLESDDANTQKDAIYSIKQLIDSKAEEFHKGDMYDLRSIGGGCIFYTKGDLGAIKQDTVFKRMIQFGMQYDAVVVAHGSNVTKAGLAEFAYSAKMSYNNTKKAAKMANISVFGMFNAQEFAEYDNFKRLKQKADWSKEKLAELQTRAKQAEKSLQAAIDSGDKKTIEDVIRANNNLTEKLNALIKSTDKSVKEFKEAKKQADGNPDSRLNVWIDVYKDVDELDKCIEKATDAYNKVLKDHPEGTYWACQPVKTLKGGPYTDMNKLVAQLIKEGFKNIYIMSCNPGSHELDPKILKTPGVKIKHAVHSILSENVEYEDNSFDEINEVLDETSYDLDAYENMYADASDYFTPDTLTEAGTISNTWNKVKDWIRTAIKKIIEFFKRIIEKIKSFIERVKNFFKNRKGKLSKKVSSGVIHGDGKVEEFDFDDYEELKKKTVQACDELSKMIQKYEQESIKGMQEAEKYADQQSKKAVNESVSDFNILVDMLW